MSRTVADLPDDPAALRHFASALQHDLAVREATVQAQTLLVEKLKHQLAVLRRARFGRSSEKLDVQVEQLELLIGDIEESAAEAQATPIGTQQHDRARQTCFCGVFRSATSASSRRRSEAESVKKMPLRIQPDSQDGPQTETPHGLNRQGSTTRSQAQEA